MAKHFAQDHAGVERDILVLITGMGGKQNLALPGDVFDRRPTRTDLSPEEVVEDLHDVLPGFEIEARDMDDEQVQQVGAVRLLRELREKLRYGLWIGKDTAWSESWRENGRGGKEGRRRDRNMNMNMNIERRTSIAIEHAFDLLQVLADVLTGLGRGPHRCRCK